MHEHSSTTNPNISVITVKMSEQAHPLTRATPEQRRLACSVMHERYKSCTQTAVVEDVLGRADLSAPTRKCGHLFADLSEFCAEYLRTGELQTQHHGKR